MLKREEEQFNPERYSISVKKELVDGAWMYVARVRELPDVVVYESDSQSAREGALEVISNLHDLAVEEGSPFPEPEEESQFSGRVTLRMPKWLHRDLALSAEREDISINQLMVAILARGHAIAAAYPAASPIYIFPATTTPTFEFQIPGSGGTYALFHTLNEEQKSLQQITPGTWQ